MKGPAGTEVTIKAFREAEDAGDLDGGGRKTAGFEQVWKQAWVLTMTLPTSDKLIFQILISTQTQAICFKHLKSLLVPGIPEVNEAVFPALSHGAPLTQDKFC